MGTIFGIERQKGVAGLSKLLVHEGPTWYTVYVPAQNLDTVKQIVGGEKRKVQLISDKQSSVESILPLPHGFYQRLKSGNMDLAIAQGAKKVEYRAIPQKWLENIG